VGFSLKISKRGVDFKPCPTQTVGDFFQTVGPYALQERTLRPVASCEADPLVQSPAFRVVPALDVNSTSGQCLNRVALEMTNRPVGIENVDEKAAAGRQHSHHLLEDAEVLALGFEVAEGRKEVENPIEAASPEREEPHIRRDPRQLTTPSQEGDRQIRAEGPITALTEGVGVTARPARQIENRARPARAAESAFDKFDVLLGFGLVAVGVELKVLGTEPLLVPWHLSDDTRARRRYAAPVIDWIEVPARRFWMGGGARDCDNPRHEVAVSAFRLARTPVTRELYARFLSATGKPAPAFWSEAPFTHPRMPVVGVSWLEASAFCTWASDMLGRAVHLPTEAEWESAASGGREFLYPWGNDAPEDLPDYPSRWLEGPEPVDAYPSLHPEGFLGLGENVHEWCSDWFDPDYYSASPEQNPRGPVAGKRRASRGGAWRHQVKVSRCVARSAIAPHLQYSDYGFRVAAGAPGAPSA
jgi:formylglycine-generating enzyme required for sulfatase activity